MKQFPIFFHVNEENEEGAREWLDRVRKILQAYHSELVTSTGAGTWCEGHIQPPVEEQPAPAPAQVLRMGPRE